MIKKTDTNQLIKKFGKNINKNIIKINFHIKTLEFAQVMYLKKSNLIKKIIQVILLDFLYEWVCIKFLLVLGF